MTFIFGSTSDFQTVTVWPPVLTTVSVCWVNLQHRTWNKYPKYHFGEGNHSTFTLFFSSYSNCSLNFQRSRIVSAMLVTVLMSLGFMRHSASDHEREISQNWSQSCQFTAHSNSSICHFSYIYLVIFKPQVLVWVLRSATIPLSSLTPNTLPHQEGKGMVTPAGVEHPPSWPAAGGSTLLLTWVWSSCISTVQ